MNLSKDWQKFDHEEGYQKRVQDVRLKNGDILYGCWPNAGVWNVMYKTPNPKYYGKPEVSVSETDEVKLHESEFDPLTSTF